MNDARNTLPPIARATLHRDGSLTVWSVYRQQWVRTSRPSDELLASMTTSERERILRHLERHAQEARS